MSCWEMTRNCWIMPEMLPWKGGSSLERRARFVTVERANEMRREKKISVLIK